MSDLSDFDHWYLAQTKPRQLVRARTNLARQGFGVFVPEREATVRKRTRFVTELRPVFPGYVFVHIEPGRSWYPVRNTFGIARIVAFGSAGPKLVPSGLMEALIAQFAEQERLQPELRAGMKVRIVGGPFAGLIAQIEESAEADRIRILLGLMSGTVRTSISRKALEVL